MTLMCETVKVNYHLVFILLTSDGRALSVILASTYSEEGVFVTSCHVFAFKLHFPDWPMNNINMRYRAIQLWIYYIYSIRWSSWTSTSSVCQSVRRYHGHLIPFQKCILNLRGCTDPKVRSWPSQQDYSIYHWEMDEQRVISQPHFDML